MEQNFNPYTNPSPMKETPPTRTVFIKPNYFEIFSFGFALASIFCCSIIYLAYIFGGLAILFALLSRGAQMKLSRRAKRGLLLGIIGIVLSTVLFIGAFMILLEEYGSLEGILRAGSEMMGLDFEKEFGNLFQ